MLNERARPAERHETRHNRRPQKPVPAVDVDDSVPLIEIFAALARYSNTAERKKPEGSHLHKVCLQVKCHQLTS